MATRHTNDSAYVGLKQEATLTATEQNIGALKAEWVLEKGWTSWENYITQINLVLAFVGVPASLRATVADAENQYYTLLADS